MNRITPQLVLVAACLSIACHDATSPITNHPTTQFDRALPTYTVIDLGTMGGVRAVASGINNSGVVTGASFAPNRPAHVFVWSADGGAQDLGTIGNINLQGYGLNQRNTLVGGSPGTVVQNGTAFIWTQENGLQQLFPAPSDARAINSRGDVVGTLGSMMFLQHQARAFIWNAKDGLTELGNLPNGDAATPYAINENGTVAGCGLAGPGGNEIHAFTWSKQTGMRDIGFVGPLPSPTGAMAINNRGDVAGVRIENPMNGQRGFLWTAATGMQEIHPPGAVRSWVYGMNDRGQLVGTYVSGTPARNSGFVWSAQAGYVTLPELRPGQTIAWAINDAGVIVGQSRDPTGSLHAVMWRVD